jgi:hypothetical protein
MKLHEIIKHNEDHKTAILIESMLPYKRSLLTYYRDLFPSEPVLMVVAVCNAVQYAKIVPSGEFSEAIEEYIDADSSEEDKEFERECIASYSIMLSDL